MAAGASFTIPSGARRNGTGTWGGLSAAKPTIRDAAPHIGGFRAAPSTHPTAQCRNLDLDLHLRLVETRDHKERGGGPDVGQKLAADWQHAVGDGAVVARGLLEGRAGGDQSARHATSRKVGAPPKVGGRGGMDHDSLRGRAASLSVNEI